MNRTINDLFFSVVEPDLDRAILYKRGSQWLSVSLSDLYRYVMGTARLLRVYRIGHGDPEREPAGVCHFDMGFGRTNGAHW